MLYDLTKFDGKDADFYDLFYLTEKPGKYSVTCRGRKFTIEVVEDEDGTRALKYESKWYRSFADLCQKAEMDGDKLTTIYDEIQVA